MRIASMLAVLFALAFLALPPVHAAPPDSLFGINGCGWSHLGANTEQFSWNEGVRRFEALKAVGAKWDRVDLWWGRIEPERGKFDFRDYDRVVELYNKNDIGLMPILCYDAGWHANISPNTPEYQAEYGRYVYEVVKHYKGKLNTFEVWNEPNISIFWHPEPDVENYAKTLKIAYREAKRANPDCIVVGAVTAGCDTGFIRGLLQRGCGDFMDVISIHPYQGDVGSVSPEVGGFRGSTAELKALMKEFDFAKPIWITEMGWSTFPGGKVTESAEANYLIRSYVYALADGYQRFFYFNLQDWSERWGCIRMDFSRKPSFYAYQTCVKMLEGRRFAKELSWGEGTRSFLFTGKGRNVLAAWALGKSRTLGIRVGGAQLWRTDQGGNRSRIAARDGLAVLNLTESPVFITGLPDDFELVRSPLRIALTPSSAPPGELTMLALSAKNPFAAARSATLKLALPKGWRAERPERIVKLPAGGSCALRIPVRVPDGEKAGAHALSATLDFGAGGCWQAALDEVVAEPVGLGLAPSDPPGVTVTLTNRSATRPISAAISVDSPFAPLESRLSLAPGETKVETLRFTDWKSPEPGLGQPVKVTAVAMGHPVESKTRFFFARCPKVSGITVDGDLSEWSKLPAQRVLRRPGDDPKEGWSEDLSASFRTGWDDANFYLAVEVEDPGFSQNYIGEEIWRGDSVQFSLDPEYRRAPDQRDSYELGLALTKAGPQVFQWTGPNGGGNRQMTEARLAVVRVGTKTRYEVAIPLASLKPLKPEPGRVFGFALIVNTEDPDARRRWIEWSSGIVREKQANLYGDMTFE